MSKIEASTKKEFTPTPAVYLRNIGDFVKGEVLSVRDMPKDKYGKIKPVVNLKLMDAQGEFRLAKSPVDVEEGTVVGLFGSTTDLMDKLPRLPVGKVVTITYLRNVDTGKGNPFKEFDIDVEG